MIPTANAIERIARQTSHEAAAWAVSQWELRKRAHGKFHLANEMLFDRDGLEMATHEAVAAYHAWHFPREVSVVDLTAGIGSDLTALSRRGPSMGWDLESDRVQIANYNLGVHGLPPTCRMGDGLDGLGGFEFAFCDPARRSGGQRSVDPEDFSPNPKTVAEAFSALRLGLIKLTPLLPDGFIESLGPGFEFISYGGECREVLVHCGSEAKSGRWATHLETGEMLEAGAPPERADEPSRCLYDADPAAVRAHALGGFGLKSLGDHPGYLTGDSLVRSAWLRPYRVLGFDRYDRKRLRAALRGLSAKGLVLKQRGAGLDLSALQREYRSEIQSGGDRELVLIFYAESDSIRVVLAELAE